MPTFVSELLRELRNVFNFNDCVEGILFEGILPLNYVFSDFLLKRFLKSPQLVLNTWTAIFIDYSIAYPGFVVLLINI